jgi:hypothetical protein
MVVRVTVSRIALLESLFNCYETRDANTQIYLYYQIP